MQRLGKKIKAFYNEQLKIDEDVVSFLEKREENMNANMLQKAEGFDSTRNNSRNFESSWMRETKS